MENEKIEYCTCEGKRAIYTEFDDFNNQWDVCANCNKPIEWSYVENPEHSTY